MRLHGGIVIKIIIFQKILRRRIAGIGSKIHPVQGLFRILLNTDTGIIAVCQSLHLMGLPHLCLLENYAQLLRFSHIESSFPLVA